MDGASVRVLGGPDSLAKLFGGEPEEDEVHEAPASARRTFGDVHGVDEAKGELRELVSYLKDPTRFKRLGAKLPAGMLMVGPPGTGKTLLARAVAGEAGVPFFHAAGPSFEEKYVGVGAQRIRKLFAAAKKKAPCVVFIDEIDAVGARRDAEREQSGTALPQLLTELDGFESADDVVLLAATNLPEKLDPALTRPGRLDRTLAVPLPDVKGRKDILGYHFGTKPLVSGEVDVADVARGTPGFSGAELENLANIAAWRAALEDAECIEPRHVEAARERVVMGTPRASAVVSEKARELTAWHEAGHAVVAMLTDGAEEVHKATIVPHGSAGGMVVQLPDPDESPRTYQQMLASLEVLMAGRAAEELVYGKRGVTGGASSDIRQATRLARVMVEQYGLDDCLGPVFHGRDASDREKAAVDDAVRLLVSQAAQRARGKLKRNGRAHSAVKDALLEHETLDAEQLSELVAA